MGNFCQKNEIRGFIVNRKKKEQLDKLSQIKQCAKAGEKNYLKINEISKVKCIKFY